MAFFLKNEHTGQFARHDSEGEHDQRTTGDINLAWCFETRAAAYDFAQNFGPDWRIEEWSSAMTNHPNRSKQPQAQHTPGPWVDMGLRGHPDGDNGEFHEIQFHTGTAEQGNRSSGHVCDIHVLAANEQARAIAKANARLIAAAPELLAEFKETLEYIVGYAESADSDDPVHEMLKRWQALVAKAEGRH